MSDGKCMACFMEDEPGEAVVTDICPECGDVVRLCAGHERLLEPLRSLRCRKHRKRRGSFLPRCAPA